MTDPAGYPYPTPDGTSYEQDRQRFNELCAWVRACLDFEERQARAASEGPWGVAPMMPSALGFAVTVREQELGDAACIATARHEDALHIAYHDPTATLRKVAALRRLIEDAQTAFKYSPEETQMWDTIAVLAEPYDIFPGYRDEWRPR